MLLSTFSFLAPPDTKEKLLEDYPNDIASLKDRNTDFERALAFSKGVVSVAGVGSSPLLPPSPLLPSPSPGFPFPFPFPFALPLFFPLPLALPLG